MAYTMDNDDRKVMLQPEKDDRKLMLQPEKVVSKSAVRTELNKIKDVLLILADRIDAIPVQDKQPALVIKKQDRINYVLNGVCDYYETPKDILLQRYRKPKYANRKKILVKLMRDIADISYDEISESLGFSKQTGIWEIYKNITEDLQEGSYGNKELKQEYKSILTYLNL